MTCPTTAVFDGLPAGDETHSAGQDTSASSATAFKRANSSPAAATGEFRSWTANSSCEDIVGVEKGVGGGNIILLGAIQPTGAGGRAEAAVEAIGALPGVITPFPGGVARSGSKVGSRYKALKASTADAYCPTLRGRVETQAARRRQRAPMRS